MKTSLSQRYPAFRSCPPFRIARNFRGLLVAWVSALSLLAAVPLSAQGSTGTIEGRVQNAVSGDYLNNARISVVGTNRIVFSDSAGDYRIGSLPAGPQTLRISYTGLEAQEITVQVAPGGTVRQDVSLTSASRYALDPKTVKLDPFTVVATREIDAASLAINEQRYAANIKNVVAADAFGDVSEGNVGEFVKRLPGIIINYAAGDAYSISVRGFAPEYTAVTVDGNLIPSASFSANSLSRGNNLEQVSMNNMARVEVIKSIVPSISADSLGGTVNLVSKSAFERSKPQLIVRGTLQFTLDDFALKNTPGPGSRKTSKVRPGYELSYVNPLTKNFGFTLNSLLSDQFGKLLGPFVAYEFAPGAGGSETAPYLRGFRTTDDPRETKRESYAGNVDWRPFSSLTLSLGYRYSVYDLFTAPTRLGFNTGTNPVASSPTFTRGRTGAGTVAHEQIWTSKFGNTKQFNLSGKFERGRWKADFSGSIGDSKNRYADVDEGFFSQATTSIPSATVRFEGANGVNMPSVVTVTNAAGQRVDWTRLDNYRLNSVFAGGWDTRDEIDSATFNLRRGLEVADVPAVIKVGASYRGRAVDRRLYLPRWVFVGADGVAGTADDTAAPFVDKVYTGVDAKFNTPTDIQWPNLNTIYSLYREHPSYFVLQQPAAFISNARDSERIEEEIDALYFQGELSAMKGRLFIVGGVRMERTKNSGVGLKRDRNAVYQRSASGSLLRDAAGRPILITTDPIGGARLEWQERGLSASRTYSGYYPSVNATFSVTPDLLFRLSYATTLGRPNFTNVLPNLDIIEPTAEGATIGQISARNPGLKPWTGTNYEASLEYYFKRSGVVSAGVFRKNIKDGFGSKSVTVNDAVLEEFELDQRYRDWVFVTTFNVGAPVTITGIELNYQQQLTFLPAWARGFSAFGNLTVLDLDGPETAFSSFYTKTANWGLSFSRGRVGASLAWNYRGARSSVFTSIGPDGVAYTRELLTLDLTSECRLTPKISVFLNARNVTNALTRIERFTSKSPAYSRPYSWQEGGVKISAGIRGQF
ncbi:MAG: TonB-dependent receptor [Verrucomicrobia bacterium]|nr:TonB-dependent receptor [Verrucomicrobiota bacterium]